MREADLSREHEDPHAASLPALLVDRQRVVHSSAFRRLQHKTQVFVAPQSDHFRTRLTHTLEVAHQARCLAAVLGADGDLAEVVALAHDLGHPPFGHAGEQALDERLREHGGFEHNLHTLRIVEHLEHPYPEFYGLNLTRVVRECLAKHSTRYDRPGEHPLQDGRPAPLESTVVDLADRLTYALHDLLDASYAGLLTPRDLQAVELWRSAYRGPESTSDGAWLGHLRPATDRMQAAFLNDVRCDADAAGETGVRLSAELSAQFVQLEEFLLSHVYRSEPLAHADSQAHSILTAVFESLVAHPDRLPTRFRKRLSAQTPPLVVADYVAGMTDRFCLEEHARLRG